MPATPANHLVGAVLMGVGGVTALGCTIGQGLSGAVDAEPDAASSRWPRSSAGAVAALRYQVWRIERAADARDEALMIRSSRRAAATDADLERRFGGLRRLYGDAAYARIRAAHVVVVGARRRRLVGRRGAGAQRRRRADA